MEPPPAAALPRPPWAARPLPPQLAARAALPASLQAPSPAPAQAPAPQTAPTQAAPSPVDALKARDQELDAARARQRDLVENQAKLRIEIDALGADRRKFNEELIDTAARMDYLMLMPPEKLRAFLIRYQDRVLYGTDLDLPPEADFSDALKDFQSTYARDWKFLATSAPLSVNGKPIHGLNLPRSVLEKIYRTNALHWIPGL